MTKNIVSTLTVFTVLLLCCVSHQHTIPAPQDFTNVSDVPESEKIDTNTASMSDNIEAKLLRNIRESKYRLTTEEIIAYELKMVMDVYERTFMESIPNCEQCSNLELLLILERVINANYIRYIAADETITMPPENITSVSYLEKEEMVEMKDKLKEIETKYEEKFNSEVPWWWMCPIKERIRRLEEAIKTEKIYGSYAGAGDILEYKFTKDLATYELIFKKLFPISGDMTRDQRLLKQAIEMDLPFLSCDEDTKLKTILKTEYQERFFKTEFQKEYGQIPDVVLSITRVCINNLNFKFSVTRTETGGAIAKDLTKARTLAYHSYPGYGLSAPLELELSTGEWLDFINTLYNLILAQERKEKNMPPNRVGIEYPGPRKTFYIDLLYNKQSCTNAITDWQLPSHYLDERDFKKLIENMAARIKTTNKKNSD
jgi:hypothetical protein